MNPDASANQGNVPVGGGGGDAIGALIGLGATIYASETAKKNTKRTIEANKQLAEYQYAQDKAMWEQANFYNSPEQQMARLKAAGLNPNLAYGSGSVSGNTTGQLPKYNAPTVDYTGLPPTVNVPAAIAAYQDFRLRQAQTDNVKAHTEQTRVNTAIQAGVNTATKEHKLTMMQYADPLKNAILQNQAQASNVMADTNRAKLSNLIQQNQNLKAAESNVKADTLFKKFRNDWMRMGFTSSDNIGFRIIARMLQENNILDWSELGKYGGQIFKPQR